MMSCDTLLTFLLYVWYFLCDNPKRNINEGICQLLFFEGDPCSTTYEDRKGKYQNQPEQVTLAKI